MKDMKTAVNKIIRPIKRGLVFDSHFVISQIIKDKHLSDVYIHFAAGKEKTRRMHGRIANYIGDSGLVKRLPQKSWSDNIHGYPNACTLWKRESDRNTSPEFDLKSTHYSLAKAPKA